MDVYEYEAVAAKHACMSRPSRHETIELASDTRLTRGIYGRIILATVGNNPVLVTSCRIRFGYASPAGRVVQWK